jgi:hypothetical protein
MGDPIEDVRVKLSADTSAFFSQVDKAVTGATTRLGKIGSTLTSNAAKWGTAIAGAAAAFASWRGLEAAIAKTQQLGLDVHEVSEQTGMAAEQASRWVFVAAHMGLATNDLLRSLGILAKKLKGVQDEETGVTTGGKTTAQILGDVGVKATDSGGNLLELTDIILPLSDVFAAMPDGIEKTGLAMQLFGRGGRDMIEIMNQGSAGLKDLMQQADKLGLVLSEKNVRDIKAFTFAQRDMGQAAGALKLQIGLALMPVLTRFFHWLIDMEPRARVWVNNMIAVGRAVADNVSPLIRQLSNDLASLKDWVEQNQVVLVALGVGLASLVAIAHPLVAAIAGITAAIELYRTDMTQLSPAMRTVKQYIDPIVAGFAGLGEIIRAVTGWLLEHKTILVGAIIDIGLAFVWANPLIAILGGVVAALGLFRTNVNELPAPLLTARRILDQVALGFLNVAGAIIDIMNLHFGPIDLTPWEDNFDVLQAKVDSAKAAIIGDLGDIQNAANSLDARNLEAQIWDLTGVVVKLGEACGASLSYLSQLLGESEKAIAMQMVIPDVVKKYQGYLGIAGPTPKPSAGERGALEAYAAELRARPPYAQMYTKGEQDVLNYVDALKKADAAQEEVAAAPPMPDVVPDGEPAKTSDYKELLDEMTLTLLGLGRAAGMTDQQLAGYPWTLDLARRAAERLGLTTDDLLRIFQATGSGFADFMRALAASESLDQLKQISDAVVSSLSDLRNQFNTLFGMPSKEQAGINYQLAQLKLRRAEMVAAGASEQALGSVDRQIAKMEAVNTVRQAEVDVMRAQLDMADKTLLTDADQFSQGQSLVAKMADLSAAAQPVIDLYRSQAALMQGWMDSLGKIVFMAAALPLPAAQVPSMQTGGIVPGPRGQPQLIMAHGGEPVLPLGSSLSFSIPITVNVSGGEPDWGQVERRAQEGVTDAVRAARRRSYLQGQPVGAGIG